jgi:hypothetical protein
MASELRDVLKAHFQNRIELFMRRDSSWSGRFEVTIGPTNRLIYSRSKYDQSRCDSKQERADVIKQIEEFLDSLQ